MDPRISLPKILIYQNKDCKVMAEYLTFYGFEVIITTKENVLSKIREENYDLCILDHFKTNIPGDLKLLNFTRKINSKIPIIFVSSQFESPYVIEAFNSGVDDYVAIPYNLEELIYRVKALLKRCGIKTRRIELVYKIGNYIFDTQENVLSSDSVKIKLATKESKALALLCAYKNDVIPKDLLLKNVWRDNNYFTKRSLDVHICNIRKYLCKDKKIKLETIKGFGYSLTVQDE